MNASKRYIATEKAITELRAALAHAQAKHPPFPTCHHGYGVIVEELQELFDEIRADNGQRPAARKEAMQIAAVALRYALDLCDPDIESASPRELHHSDDRGEPLERTSE